MKRFFKMGVYRYVDRAVAMQDAEGKFIKVKLVRVRKGDQLFSERWLAAL